MSYALIALVLLVACTLAYMALSLGRKGGIEVLRNAKEEWPFVLLLLASLGGRAWAERSIVISVPPLLLPDAFHLLGKEVAVMQSRFPGELVSFFSFLYVIVFPLTLLTASLWILSRDHTRFRTYCASVAIASLILLMAHMLILSTRPALDPASGISPLLYQDPLWGPLSSHLISRGQSFPSGHTVLLTVVVLSLQGEGRAVTIALSILCLTMPGLLYLGLHWPADLVFGLLLGWFSAVSGRSLLGISGGGRPTRWRRGSL